MAQPAFAQVTPHIFKLDLPFLRGRVPVGVWLVRDDQGWIMVDAGAPGFEQTVLDEAVAHPNGDHPYMLVLTHGHSDHAAAARQVRELWKIPVAAGRDEMPFLLGPRRYSSLPARSPLYRLMQRSGPALLGRAVQRPLDEGMRVGDMRVYHVPGHAPGMLALLHPGDRALLCADTFYNLNERLADPSGLFTYDPQLNRESQAKLLALDFDHLLPSHGPPILNEGKERARALVARRQKRRRNSTPQEAAA
jgi:glyoxylase-like metal-dependent hydrolase (beta-lactamase superfamily II)